MNDALGKQNPIAKGTATMLAIPTDRFAWIWNFPGVLSHPASRAFCCSVACTFVSLQKQLTNLPTRQNTYSRRFSLFEHAQQQEVIACCFVNSDLKWSLPDPLSPLVLSHARRCSHSLAYPRMSG